VAVALAHPQPEGVSKKPRNSPVTLLEHVPIVTVVAPSETWAAEFGSVGPRLRNELGALALRIDHIGSTAVPGLAAKDILDIQVAVAEVDEALLAPAFARAGFRVTSRNRSDHQPPGSNGPATDWQKLYVEPVQGRRINVHVRVAGKPNQRYALLCRDFLRAHPTAAQAYALFKQRLAARGMESSVYADIKEPVFDLILHAAESWAAHTGWQPAPSDA
jgi:GrpB-like predicted nucleotidyltransferase (UPF0157 family)